MKDASNVAASLSSGTKRGLALLERASIIYTVHANDALVITESPPANQIQKILDHGHLLTVHDPEQETSELDTVILKALVKGEVISKPAVGIEA